MLSSQPPKPTVNAPEKPVVKIEVNKALADFLVLVNDDKCTEDMKLNFSWHKLTRENFASLVQALALGKCKRGLTIDLTGNEDLDLSQLFDVFISGNCPADMKIILKNNNILGSSVTKLIKAIQHQNFPQGCTIDITNNRFIGSIVEKQIQEAVEESKSGVKVIVSPNTILFKQTPPVPIVEIKPTPVITEDEKRQTEENDERLEPPRSKL
jgi:hypothetical protein